MNKSIETMWKQGFVNETQLSAPKINDLYNRKSQNIVDKMQNMFDVNIKAIIWGGGLTLILMIFLGMPFWGLYICCLLAPIIFIAKKELKKSVDLSKGQSSYDYIMSFNHWLKSAIDVYSGYYKIFYPLFFLGMMIQGMASDTGQEMTARLVERFLTDIMLLGQPYYSLLALILVTLIIARYAEAIYRLDLNMVYGRQFKKLDELIADMQELRN